jgi:hypothetical protein
MMARICDACRCVIDQANDEYLELQVRVLDTTEDTNQDQRAQAHGDYCDTCVHDGSALKQLLAEVDWTLVPRPIDSRPEGQ